MECNDFRSKKSRGLRRIVGVLAVFCGVFGSVAVGQNVPVIESPSVDQGIHMAGLTLSPFVSPSYTYEKNVFLTNTNKQNDSYADLLAGITFRRTEEAILRGSGQAWIKPRGYRKFTDLDAVDWGERLDLAAGHRSMLSVTVNESYSKVADYDNSPLAPDLDPLDQNLQLAEDHTIRSPRDFMTAGADFGRDFTDKTGADLGYSYSGVQYDSSSLYNSMRNAASLSVLHLLTEKTDLKLAGEYSVDDTKDFSKPGNSFKVGAGASTRSTYKLLFDGLFGVQQYYQNSSNNLDRTAFVFRLGSTWRTTDRLSFQLIGSGDIQPSAQFIDNTRLVYSASLGAQYVYHTQWYLSLAGAYRMDDYTAPVPSVKQNNQLVQALDNQYGTQAMIRYLMNRYVEIYGQLVYEMTFSDILENYDQLRATLGLRLKY